MYRASLCYKLEQLCFITNQGKRCYKLGQLHYYKLGQVLLQNGAAIANQCIRYNKIGQLLQIGTIFVTNWAGTINQGNYCKLGHNIRPNMKVFQYQIQISVKRSGKHLSSTRNFSTFLQISCSNFMLKLWPQSYQNCYKNTSEGTWGNFEAKSSLQRLFAKFSFVFYLF